MIVEHLLTAYLKRRHSRILQLDRFSNLDTARPEPGKVYLLYVHIPFCEELCPYCSFNRFPLDRDLAREYFEAVSQEALLYADRGFDFQAAYVGGGTPTVLPEEVGRLLDLLRNTFSIRQISLETNPNHLTDNIVKILQQGGVKRLSVGVQSFDDNLLRQMERYHKYGSGAEIRDRLAQLMGAFDTLNVDMMFNFPTQTMSMLESDVQIIKAIKADQVTFYPLMVSDMTRSELAAKFGPISYQREKLFYEQIVASLREEYSCGSAWCFSRQHTMIDEYIVDYDEYVGIGSGSFGYINGACFANTFSISEYLLAIKERRLPILAKREFSIKEQIQYDFMMKLFGMSLDLKKAEKKYAGQFLKTLWKEVSLLRLTGALDSERGVLRLTPKGQYLWVIMMREFFTGVNNFRDTCRSAIKSPNECVQQ
jgi:coproporphyrinogen III oxidase-like Fe-S oxidoreductase